MAENFHHRIADTISKIKTNYVLIQGNFLFRLLHNHTFL